MDNPKKKKGCGCLGIGCLVLVIIAAILIGTIAWLYTRATSYLAAHSSSSPVEVVIEGGTQDEYDALVKKLDDFKDSASGSGKTLDLSAHDLNLIVKFSPEWLAARGKLRFDIDNDLVGLTGSLPLNFMPLAPSLHGKYLNGEMHVTPSLDAGVFRCSVQSAKFNGSDLSGDDLKNFSTFLTSFMAKNPLPVLAPVLEKTKTLTVKDGTITLTSQ